MVVTKGFAKGCGRGDGTRRSDEEAESPRDVRGEEAEGNHDGGV